MQPAGPKVFCIGFQKTGTTSLHAALTRLGYKTAAVVGRGLTAEELRRDGARLCVETARRFDAVEDMPWPVFYQELDEAFPGARFILTEREPEAWFSSIESHFGDRPDEMQRFIYGDAAPCPAGRRHTYLSVYEAHNAAVRRYFSDRPGDLLIMDLARGDGWAELCAFLGHPAPDEPFPTKNRREDRRSLRFRLRRRIARMFGGYLAPERI